MKYRLFFLFFFILFRGEAQNRKEIFDILYNFEQINETLIKCVHDSTLDIQQKYHKQIAEFGDTKYGPALHNLDKIVCRDKDELLVRAFIHVILNTKNVSDEESAYFFAHIFQCSPSFITKIILSDTNKDNKDYLISTIAFGTSILKLDRDHFDTTTMNNNFEYLKRKANILK